MRSPDRMRSPAQNLEHQPRMGFGVEAASTLNAENRARSCRVSGFGGNLRHEGSSLAMSGMSRSLTLYAQPIEPLGDVGGRGSCYELLLRVVNEDGMVEGPADLIAAVERDGLGSTLDRFVLGSFLDWLSSHRAHMDHVDTCFINLSADTLLDRAWLEEVVSILRNNPVTASKLCFEISERTPTDHLVAVADTLGQLHALGCRFALDDFGKSNCSYQFLRSIPCDFIKIDGDLVCGMAHSDVDRSIVLSIVSLAHSLGRKVVAECIESAGIREMLTDMGVDYGQGFHLGMPRPIESGLIGLH